MKRRKKDGLIRKPSAFQALKQAVSDRGVRVEVKYPLIYLDGVDYTWPNGLARMRYIVSTYDVRLDKPYV